MSPHTPAEYRLLAELERYLEREVGVTVQRPFTAADLGVLPRARDVLQRWDLLFEFIRGPLARDPGFREGNGERVGADDAGGEKPGWGLRLVPAVRAWPALVDYWDAIDYVRPPSDRGVNAALTMYPKVIWGDPRDPQIDEPAIGVGVAVDTENGWPPGLQEGEPFRRAAQNAGFCLGHSWKGLQGRIYRTKLLKELTGTTLDDQAKQIVYWAQEALHWFKTSNPLETSSFNPCVRSTGS